MADTALFDVDGTLVDTNYQHALAWYRAFRRVGITLPVWRLHRAIGMGGDQLVPAVAGDETEKRHGDELRDAETEEFDKLIDETRPFEGARELLSEVRSRGFRVVLASSGKKKHVEHFIDLLNARDLADAWTTADDVENSKPAPDLVETALHRVEGAAGIMIGDSTWDCIAARKLSVPTVAVRTGGFAVDELTEAGAVQVYDSLVEMRERLDETPLRAAD
ncbi:HAD family hydrolase [Actinoplanes sp. CA-030573]|uniref:HAD family hydrolase n=1 Tax=Actinoplanes sp. CA-030573 TaxID=3239898 RepID=UPI003D8D00AB